MIVPKMDMFLCLKSVSGVTIIEDSNFSGNGFSEKKEFSRVDEFDESCLTQVGLLLLLFLLLEQILLIWGKHL